MSKINPIRSKKIILYIYLTCILVSLPFTYFAEIKYYVDYNNSFVFEMVKECTLYEHGSGWSELVLTLIEFLFYCLIPFVVTFGFSFVSLIRLLSTQKTQTEIVVLNSRRRYIHYIKCNAERTSFDSTKSSKSKKFWLSDQPIANVANGRYLRKSEMYILGSNPSNLKLSIMLISLPVSYLISTLPIFIIIIMQFFPKFNYTKTNSGAEITIAKTFMYINNSINIFFYILLGKRLRRDFLSIFFKK